MATQDPAAGERLGPMEANRDAGQRRRSRSGGRTPPRELLLRRAASFVAAGGLLAYLGLEGAGYDIAVRQGVALGVWLALAGGLALGVLPRGRLSRTLLIPAIFALALLAWMLCSFSWTGSDERSTEELARVLGYVGIMALALLALNRYTFKAAAAGLSGAAVVVTTVSVLSRLSPSLFPDALDVAGAFVRTDRLTFPLDYWNAVGAWGAMTAAVGVAWSAHARFAVTRALSLATVPVAGLAVYLSYSRGGVISSAIAIVAVIGLSHNRWTAFVHLLGALGGTAVVILVARGQPEIADATGGTGGGAVGGALLGAALLCAGSVLVASVLKSDHARLPVRTARWAVPGFVALLVVAVAVTGHGPISTAWDEFQNQAQPTSASTDPAARLTSGGGSRKALWTSALDAFEAEPAKGIGPGGFEFWGDGKADTFEYVRDAHSLYLEQLAELGLPGLVLLLGLLGGSFAAALAARRKLTRDGDRGASVAMSCAFLVFLVTAGVDWMWEETALTVFGLGGIAIAAAAGSSRLRSDRRHGAIARPGVRAALVAVALLAAATQVPGLVSTQRVRASQQALLAGAPDAARADAEAAITAEPWAATPHQQLASVERSAGRLGRAKREIEVAIEKEPTNWRWPLVLAPIQAQAGDRSAAIQTFREGRKLAPKLVYYSPFSFFGKQVYAPDQLARIYQRQQARAAASAVREQGGG